MKKRAPVMNKVVFKKGCGIVSATAILLLVPAAAGAADITVNCVTSNGKASCSSTPSGGPLFDEKNLVPGETVVRELEVNNSHEKECVLEFNTRKEKLREIDLAERLFTVIRDVTDRYGVSDGSAAANNKKLSNLFTENPISFGTLAANSITNFEWAITFDKEAGNDWQDKETIFDFDMVFTCEEVEGGGGDEEDCCPGPDPSPAGGVVLGITSSPPPGRVAGALLSKFPVAGEMGVALWLAKEETNWSRVVSGVLALSLSIYLVLKVRRENLVKIGKK